MNEYWTEDQNLQSLQSLLFIFAIYPAEEQSPKVFNMLNEPSIFKICVFLGVNLSHYNLKILDFVLMFIGLRRRYDEDWRWKKDED